MKVDEVMCLCESMTKSQTIRSYEIEFMNSIKKVSIIFFQSLDSPDCSFREDTCDWETREGWTLSKHSPDPDLENYGRSLSSNSRLFIQFFVG